jgi:PKD repeat protein
MGQAQAMIIAGAKQNVGYIVSLDGSQSNGVNPFGQVDMYGIKHYAWSFGDGTPDQASEYLTTVTHTFATAGSYSVRLTVTDHAGARASTSSVIEVGTLPRQTATGGDIAAAITALAGKPGIVTVPAGTFTLGAIDVPAGVIIEGAGAGRTKLVGVTFSTRGDSVRITGIEADGVGKSDDNLFSHYRNKNLLVDHSDWHHYVQATSIADYATATLEDNVIHDHDYAGLGYGIQLAGGSWAMVRRNQFQRNRHSVAAGGKSGSTASEYVSMPTGYDLIDNSISGDAVNRDVTVDMHPTGHGRVRIVGNQFENVGYGIGLFDGWGEIRGNTFTDVSGYVILSRRPVHNGNFIASAGVYRLDIADNTFIKCRNHYQIEYGTNITIEGKPVAPPYNADVPPP